MYEICLSDSRVICRHVDQLRLRVSSAESETSTMDSAVEDTTVGDGASRQTVEPETAGAEQSSSGVSLTPAVEASESDPPAYAPVVVSSQAEESPEQQGDESTESRVCKTTRVRHPPVRFEEQCYVIG